MTERAQKVIFRDMIFEDEAVEQRSLPRSPLAHHADIAAFTVASESVHQDNFKQDLFNGIGG